MGNKVIKNASAYMLANLIGSIVNFLLLPVYTRFLTPADFGVLAMVTAFSSFLVPFMGLQLTESLRRSYFDHDDANVRALFSTILYSIVVINVGLLGLVHVGQRWIMAVAFANVNVPYRPYILLAMGIAFVQNVVNLCNLMLQVQQKGGTVLSVAGVRALINAGAGLYFVVALRMGAEGALLGRLAAVTVTCAHLLWLLRRHVVATFRTQRLREGLHYSLPMIPHVLGGVVFMYSDKLILGYFLPLATVGLYEIANRIAMVMKQAVVAFDRAIAPVFMHKATRSRDAAVEAFRPVIVKWMAAALFLFLCFSLFAEELLVILAPPEYRGAWVLVPVLTAAFVFRGLYQFTVKPILFDKKTAYIPAITGTAGMLNVVGNVLLIPLLGVHAAAWTTLLAFAWTFGMTLLVSKRCFSLSFDWRQITRLVLLALLALLVPMAVRSDTVWINLLLKVVSLGAFVVAVWVWDCGGITGDILHLLKGCRSAGRNRARDSLSPRKEGDSR